MTTDPGLPNLPDDWENGDTINAGNWNDVAARVNDVEDDNANDVEPEDLAAAMAGRQPRFLVGTTAVAGNIAAKTVTLDAPAGASYQPAAGDVLLLRFAAGSAVSSPTLSVNGEPALPIQTPTGSGSSTNLSIAAGATVLLLHDGTIWRTMGLLASMLASFTAAELQAGSSGSARVVTPTLLAANLLNMAAGKPASATATGRRGQFWVDATGLYVCIDTNTWRLFAGSTF